MSRRDWGLLASNLFLFVMLLAFVRVARSCERERPATSSPPVSTPVENPIKSVLETPTPREYRDGIAAAILIDTSGSMRDKVKDTDGAMQPKIDIAQRAAMNLVEQFVGFAREHPEKQIVLGIYEFSDRERQPATRAVVALGPPDANAARGAIMSMRAAGGTPIGDAMIQAKLDLDRTSLSRRHIVVVTDGENTRGYRPDDVTRSITNLSDNDRASVYFVAFDVAASKFDRVRESGGLVLASSNETDLRQTLDYLLTGKILAEQPETR